MTKQINLSDFDFSQPYIARSYKGRDAIADMCVTVGVKGKTRKANNNNILLTGFFKRTGADFKTMIIGTNKFSKKVNVIVAFDVKQPNVNPANIGHSVKSGVYFLSSKGMVRKLYEAFGVNIPDVPGTATRFYFNLEEVEGMPKVYSVNPVMLERIDAYGSVTRADLQRLNIGENKREEQSRIMA
jgi:hypothetical protein